jgi:hypothetical protein
VVAEAAALKELVSEVSFDSIELAGVLLLAALSERPLT